MQKLKKLAGLVSDKLTLREKYPYSEFFYSVFSHIQTAVWKFHFNQLEANIPLLYSWKTAENFKGSSIKYIRKIFQKANISTLLIRPYVCVSGG